jgi:glyoxylase-like metal-dependent hydrolase (beta-lactamase superfamily II)
MDYLQSPDLNLASLAGISQPSGEADIKGLEDGEVLNLCQSKFKIIQTPGHTSGSICLYVEGILFSGDTLFFDSVGRCDLPGGNCNKLIDSIINKLLVLPDETKVYPGHGPQTTIGREKRYNPFL